MRPARVTAAIACFTAFGALAANRVAVTVVEQKAGKVVSNLSASDFTVLDDKTPRVIEAAEFTPNPIDVMLLVDTSLVGGMVQPVVSNLIEQLQPKEQMAIVAFDSSANLIQDFTASKELLVRSLSSVKYGNSPRVLDALYAAIDGGFEHTSFRRVLVLATAGLEGPSRVSEREVLRLARKNGVSIYPVYVVGYERGLFEMLARSTGGATFNLRDMGKSDAKAPGERIFEVLRGHYTLTLRGNLALGDKLKVEVRRPEKVFVSALPLD